MNTNSHRNSNTGMMPAWKASISSEPASSATAAAAAATTSKQISDTFSYSIGSVDLAAKWLDLVRTDQVAVTTTIPTTTGNEEETIGVRYGVRLHPNAADYSEEDDTKNNTLLFMEFVEPAGASASATETTTTTTTTMHPMIAKMNATLNAAAGLAVDGGSDDTSSNHLKFIRRDDHFVAQLQLVRTLRPPPSSGLSSTSAVAEPPNGGSSSSIPPPYDLETDSFVTGPLRLELRPRVAQLGSDKNGAQLTTTTPWDVYHNISPCDVRGHFLLVPTLLQDSSDNNNNNNNNNNNKRGQQLLASDCHDMVRLAASIDDPIGSLMICYNSVGAGASQNHIHLHLWPAPPMALLVAPKPTETETKPCQDEDCQEDHDHDHDGHDHSHSHALVDDDNDDDWSKYAASRIELIYDFVDVMDTAAAAAGGDDDQEEEEVQPLVQVSYLNYPCFCVELSSCCGATSKQKSLDALGNAVWAVLSCLGDAPHNVCVTNRESYSDDEDDDGDDTEGIDVDVKIFVRSRERSPTIVTTSKLGASEMMGVFHCSSVEQLEELVGDNSKSESKTPPMVQALQDVSYEDSEALWETIRDVLSSLEL